ncbi:hypothetical protein K505DRAFT_268188 [Melanomma pulvis-pyrius CBS 109.77]|uniref:DUF7580 domain-containing protein n=1 Tax=Melanomma pulvis-pyrius CBS 109.77 TaxID=1314802 RepID=A0A6A6XNW0_9PLEO|nr:hypothetical protein K505DRAFT_268188 [Melanomma pulvis-pyrius CBS 109.77]
MAEVVAGLVLGGIPIAIWALDKYAEPFEAYHKYRTSIETFRTNLILQKWHLQTTLSNIGLSSEPSIDELRECFETKYSSISRELMFIVQRMDEITARLINRLDINVNGKPNTLPDKAQWEWRRVKHSLSTKKRNKVVEDLRYWNEDLRRSLEKSEVPAEDDSRKVQDLKRRFNSQRCNSIRQCLISLHRALESGLRCACSPPHQAAIDLDWTMSESDIAKTFKVAISYGSTPQPPKMLDSWRKLCITSEQPTKMVDSTPELLTPPPPPDRALSPTSSIRFKVPHLKFIRSSSRTPPPTPPITIAPPPNLFRTLSTVSNSASTRINSLCVEVCTERNPWTLTGFLKDPDEDQDRRFSLGHSQTDLPKIIKAVPLKSLLSSHEQSTQQRNPYLSLSAKQRYGIAASIAWAVLHLGGSLWFGDYWDQNQLCVFLEKNEGGREVLSRHPCASYNFSSPASLEEPPTDDFKHLIPNRTVFALGIFLIELCTNKPFAETRQAGNGAMPASLLDEYQAALSNLDEVYRLAGDSYGYAVERCVKFSFQGRDVHKDFDFSQFRQQFHDAVVAPIQATYLMLPDSHNPW